MLSMTEKRYEEICQEFYPDVIDDERSFDFVMGVLRAEADAIRERYPYATKTIERLEAAAYTIFEIGSDVSGGNFEEEQE